MRGRRPSELSHHDVAAALTKTVEIERVVDEEETAATIRTLHREAGYLSAGSYDYMRPENLPFVSGARERYRDMTLADVERLAEHWPWGTADEVAERIQADAVHAGASTVLLSLNRGAMPHEMFVEQLRRFATKVLPALQAHTVTRTPLA